MADGLYVGRKAFGWFVFNADGEPLTMAYTTELEAGRRLDTMLRQKRLTTRPCITCGTPFKSEGAHHRMCKACRGRDNDPAYNVVPSSGRSPLY